VPVIRLRWSQTPSGHESLAGSLCALLAGFGDWRTYGEVMSVLGLGSAVVAVADECPRWWSGYARDAALLQAAELLGLRLRDLHPPAAATNLSHSAEFPQHFQDSYVPLIKRALVAGQPLLAWCGWPSPAERAWGVLCEVRGDELRGYAVGAGAEPVPLSSPAYQVYAIEGHRAPPPEQRTPAALLQHVARLTCAQWRGQLPVSANVNTGEQAYVVWREIAARSLPCPTCGAADRQCQAEAAGALVSARRSLAAWLRTLTNDLDYAWRAVAEDWVRACERVAAGLAALNEQNSSLEWVRAIEAAQETEAALVARLETILREHGYHHLR
jgi:hypothetical protein